MTDTDGTATIQSPMVRGASTFTFCVHSLAGSTINDQAGLDSCASSGSTPPPASGSPSGLSVQWKTNGNARAQLSWTGGGSMVDIYRDGSVLATVSNTESYRDNNPGDRYRVCNAA